MFHFITNKVHVSITNLYVKRRPNFEAFCKGILAGKVLAWPCMILFALEVDTGIVKWAESSMQKPCIYNEVCKNNT